MTRDQGATVAEPPPDPYDVARAAATELARRTGVDRHDAVVVLGSGWSGAAEALGTTVAEVAVTDLPGFWAPVADGHVGLVRSMLLPGSSAHAITQAGDVAGGPREGGVRLLVFLGRTHLYEGHGAPAVAHAVRTAAASGCRLAVLTNANGSLRPDWGPGTGVVIRDHLNLALDSPLRGPRFVDMTHAWTPAWRDRARRVDPGLVEGVYAMLRGPHYETVAEALMLRVLGADVVGMSTVLEAIAAREAGMDLLGLSVVTTVEASGEVIDSEEVVRVAAAAATRLGGVIADALCDGVRPHEKESRDGI